MGGGGVYCASGGVATSTTVPSAADATRLRHLPMRSQHRHRRLQSIQTRWMRFAVLHMRSKRWVDFDNTPAKAHGRRVYLQREAALLDTLWCDRPQAPQRFQTMQRLRSMVCSYPRQYAADLPRLRLTKNRCTALLAIARDSYRVNKCAQTG